MNATVMTNEDKQTLVKSSLVDEVLFFVKATAIVGTIILLAASSWA